MTGDETIGRQGTTHLFWCPDCCTDFVFKDTFEMRTRIREYPVTCTKCGKALIVRSSPNTSFFLALGITGCFLLAVQLSLPGSYAPVLAVLSAVAFLALIALGIVLRRYQVLPAVAAETKKGKGPLLDPNRDPVSFMLVGLGRIWGARRGILDSIGRWCVISGFLTSTVCFIFNRYLTIISLVAWLAEWIGLGVLLRKNESFIVSAGGSFLLSTGALLLSLFLGHFIGGLFGSV